jgi:hypothetical protein
MIVAKQIMPWPYALAISLFQYYIDTGIGI